MQAAYAVVGDSQQRPMYDAWLNSGLAISYKYVRPRVRCGSFASVVVHYLVMLAQSCTHFIMRLPTADLFGCTFLLAYIS